VAGVCGGLGVNPSLFHYCSNQTFFSIFRNAKLWLSPITASNDSDEGSYISSVFFEMCDEADIRPKLRDVSKVLVSTFKSSTEGFGLCLSEAGDLLSQWRAYAGDGEGFSVGFSSEALQDTYQQQFFGKGCFELKKISYSKAEAREMLRPVVEKIAQISSDLGDFVELAKGYSVEKAIAAFQSRNASLGKVFTSLDPDSHLKLMTIMEAMRPIHFRIYDFKSASFHEEREHRILRFRQRDHFDEIRYTAATNQIRPYIEVDLSGSAMRSVVEVITGPKSKSNIDWVSAFLKSCNFHHVKVRKSEITSYR
jgi:Protein of unknown function (DUF2971)